MLIIRGKTQHIVRASEIRMSLLWIKTRLLDLTSIEENNFEDFFWDCMYHPEDVDDAREARKRIPKGC
jgi:hypothetical protein